MEQFKHNELTFHLMVNASPNALILVNNSGNIVYVNEFAERLFEYDRNELIGRNLEILIPNKFSKSHSYLMQSYLKDPMRRQMGENRELFAVKKGGIEFPVEVGLNPIVTDDGTFILAAVIDITERKKSEKQFQLIVESAPNAIILVNSKGEIALINKQAEKEFGYTSEELTGNKIEILIPERFKHKHMEFRDMFLSDPETRAMGADRNLFALRKDGTEFHAEIGLNSIPTEVGVQILVSIINITERKNLEKAMLDNNKKIEEQNLQLKQSEQKLRQLNATKDKLFSIIAHDLRNPFNAILGLTDILSEDNDSFNEDDKKDIIFNLNTSTKAAYALLENLLNWALLQQERIEINKEEINLVEYVQECVLPYMHNSQKKKINIQIDIPKNQKIIIDKHTMGVVIGNVVNNAIKFTPEGGSVKILSNEKPDQTELWIKDSGIGMNQTQIDNLFMIEKSSSTLGTNKEKGTGLGLILCKEFTEQNGGNIRVESDKEQGSTFIISIPNKFDN